MPRKKTDKPWRSLPSCAMVLFRLSDGEWSGIILQYPLPEAARRHVENIISLYRYFEANVKHQPTPSATRKSIKALRQSIEHLRDALCNLGHDVLMALLDSAGTEGDMPNRDATMMLDDKIEVLDQLTRWLTVAEAKIAKNKPGNDTGNLDWFIHQLDYVFHKHTGKHLSRSQNKNSPVDYVKAVCAVADPTIGSGAIDYAIKRHIASLAPAPGKTNARKKP